MRRCDRQRGGTLASERWRYIPRGSGGFGSTWSYHKNYPQYSAPFHDAAICVREPSSARTHDSLRRCRICRLQREPLRLAKRIDERGLAEDPNRKWSGVRRSPGILRSEEGDQESSPYHRAFRGELHGTNGSPGPLVRTAASLSDGLYPERRQRIAIGILSPASACSRGNSRDTTIA